MGKALILCLLLAGCMPSPRSPGDPRQIWCDHNLPERHAPEVIAAMPRADLDRMNAFNDKGVRWCGWKA